MLKDAAVFLASSRFNGPLSLVDLDDDIDFPSVTFFGLKYLSKFQISIECFRKQDKTIEVEVVKFRKIDWIERIFWMEQNL